MSAYPEQIRADVANRVLASGAAIDPQWPLRLSIEPWEFLKNATHSPQHLEFAVGIPSTEPAEARQRPESGTHATTEVRVLVAYQLDSKNRVASSDDAVRLARLIRNALVAKGWTGDATLVWTRSEHTAGADGWLWLEETFTAWHAMALA